jgi:hypothetical protein
LSNQNNKVSNSGERKKSKHHRSRTHRSRLKRRQLFFKNLLKWLKKNRSKWIAILAIPFIIIITILFYLYSRRNLGEHEIELQKADNKNPIKGILLPMELITESDPVTIRFGTITKSVSLNELREGYVISPENLITCEVQTKAISQTKFIIYLVENRLYVNATFVNLKTSEAIAATDKTNWTLLPKSGSKFYSDNSSFKIYDKEGNINFDMKFNGKDSLNIKGYFIGRECVYIIGSNIEYSDSKAGNYIEKVVPQIKELLSAD